jgi:hypothetical protein
MYKRNNRKKREKRPTNIWIEHKKYYTWDCPVWAPSNTASENLLPKILRLHPSTYLERWKMFLSINTTLAVKISSSILKERHIIMCCKLLFFGLLQVATVSAIFNVCFPFVCSSLHKQYDIIILYIPRVHPD